MWKIFDFISRLVAFSLLVLIGFSIGLYSDNFGGFVIFVFFMLMAGSIMKQDCLDNK